MASVSTTPRARDGPELDTVSSYVIAAPAIGVPVARFTTEMSAWSVTSVDAVALLSDEFGSVLEAATVAVFGARRAEHPARPTHRS